MTSNNDNATTATSASSFRRRVTPYRDNAHDVLPYSVHPSAPDFEEQLLHVAKALCPPLLDLPSGISVRPLTGGLSNELFVVEATNNDDPSQQQQQQSATTIPSVLVRIHPQVDEQHSIVDRAMENRISAWLSQQKIGPTYYGRFLNGRVEEFYPFHKPLSFRDMPIYGATHVAPIMAQFHSLQVPAGVLEPTNHNQGDIFVRIPSWLKIAEHLILHTNNDNDQKEADPKKDQARQWLSTLQKEWIWLRDPLLAASSSLEPLSGSGRNDVTEMTAQRFFSQVVFTHMDMQSLNLLRDEKSDEQVVIKVIDFEYAGFNPRGMDLANTFLEYCDMNNIRPNYELEYPSIEHQNEYIKKYILNVTPGAENTFDDVVGSGRANNAHRLVDNEDFLQESRRAIGRYTLVSHLSWSIWSIIQSQVSDISFNYLDYLACRMEGYQYMKQRYYSDDDASV